MSTTIDVYPLTGYMPLVDEITSRTQELFQELLDRYEVPHIVEVKAFHPSPNTEEITWVAPGTRWAPGMNLGFAYWVDGTWNCSSFPSCCDVEDVDLIDEYSVGDYGQEWLGAWWPLAELEDRLTPAEQEAMSAQRHYWYEYRNAGGPAYASTGYGFVAAALAEKTNGRIASFDAAFDDVHNGETAAEFLVWWGDEHTRRIGFPIISSTGMSQSVRTQTLFVSRCPTTGRDIHGSQSAEWNHPQPTICGRWSAISSMSPAPPSRRGVRSIGADPLRDGGVRPASIVCQPGVHECDPPIY